MSPPKLLGNYENLLLIMLEAFFKQSFLGWERGGAGEGEEGVRGEEAEEGASEWGGRNGMRDG